MTHAVKTPSFNKHSQLKLSLSAAAVLSALSLLSAPTFAVDDKAKADDDAPTLGQVVVTSRNREEIAQDVPIPVSVISSKTLERDDVLAVSDLVKKAPGLGATTPNARRTGISLRGIGKASGNDSMEAAVGIIVDGVVLSHVGMSYQDFTDLDRIEVLRGPQGTLLGKNTTIGAINYVSKLPSFSPQTSATFSIGQYNSRAFNASSTNAIEPGLLAYRVSAFGEKQDGDIRNVNAEGGRWHEKNRTGGRLQFCSRPSQVCLPNSISTTPRPMSAAIPSPSSSIRLISMTPPAHRALKR